MPSYKTLVRILIATSVASSTLAAPITSPEEEKTGFHSSTPTRETPSTPVYPPTGHAPVPATEHAPVPATEHTPVPATEHAPVPATDHPAPGRLMSPFAWKVAAATALGGSALGVLATTLLGKNNKFQRTLQRSVEDDGPIFLRPASLSDEHLLFMRDISRWARALEKLD